MRDEMRHMSSMGIVVLFVSAVLTIYAVVGYALVSIVSAFGGPELAVWQGAALIFILSAVFGKRSV